MKKGEKISFAINDKKIIEGIVIDCLGQSGDSHNTQTRYLVYAQNRLVEVMEEYIRGNIQIGDFEWECYDETSAYLLNVFCDYCIIPEYDKILKS